MSEATLQSKRTMQKLMGTAPENVFAVRHNKKGWMGGPRPITFTSLRQARVNATSWGNNYDDNQEIEVVEFELVELQRHSRQKQRGGI